MRDYRNYQAWRSGLTPKLGLMFIALDARAAIPILPLFFYQNIFTIGCFVISTLFFGLAAKDKLRPGVMVKRWRSKFAGSNRYIGNRRVKRGRFIHDR